MEYLYCGGRFYFDFLKEGYREKAAKDYRARLLGDVDLLLKNSDSVRLSDRVAYTGPFYFEADGMIDREIVLKEMKQIEQCTCAVFLLDDCGCPGTICEMVYAASLKKKLMIYYVMDERETESSLFSPCWYPIVHCRIVNGEQTEVIPCLDHEEAERRLAERLREMVEQC